MLADARIYPTIRVTDLERSKHFYGETLGLKPKSIGVTGHTAFEVGDGFLVIYEGPPSKAEHTLCAFDVKDLEEVVRDLRSRGVVFEEYDFPGLKTVNGIADMGGERSAWFKDPDGNILAVGQLA